MAEIVDRKGNIFGTTSDVLTITVNCEGIMGAGIALEGRLRWPSMFERYAKLCDEGRIRPGVLWVWEHDAPPPPRRVLCFPTKDAWRAPSRLAFVKAGLDNLRSTYQQRAIRSISMP